MSATRIPLELIQKVFYDDGPVMTEAQNAFIEGIANDFRVQKNPEIVISKEVIFPKYPLMPRKMIPPNIPSTFYHQKATVIVPPDPELNYVPPHPRKVNIDKLSEEQKPLYGLSPFKQDLYKINQRRENYKKYIEKQKEEKKKERKITVFTDEDYQRLNLHANSKFERQDERKDKQNSPSHKNVQRMQNYQAQGQNVDPQRYYNEKYDHEEQKYFEDQNQKQQYTPNEYPENQQNYQAEEENNDPDGFAPSMYRVSKQQYEENGRIARENANRGPPEMLYYLQKDFKPTLETRASKLKAEYIRREMEKVEMEQRRLELNEDLRKEREDEAKKKIAARPVKFNADSDADKHKREIRQEMRKNEENYMNMLNTINESQALNKTLMERVEEELMK
ncbi:hypothetical protein TVAG_093450 [Trichomonas vaginalis G3]|uniref:Uncharacterized protein n=1 Tax=Trichomonas vaginalis (strain ATCC PRA-98 / G3) TaxID=412133 RepID=A2DBG8_TRIV3|nr:hypothetical protein TVAGG3_0382340 [Trichomonas vaginalis G3]EAY22171.1 hypothetical protein TVAG_093450 [Trichomonas vaginalis G3]KAI5533371.1 hypothetical protein TVAGG3_0382340 [Trichomonas vaginalis G3]|eukprot:XP_001583157.1 hypothetical protein [Trichomonas vaginalis G3]